MLRPGFIHKKYATVIFSIICFAFNFFLTTNSNAADSLSYSGRLVQANGAPVAGPVNLLVELAYSGTPTNILCSQSFTGVALTNGVFHLKLDLACGANGTIANVLSNVPAAESAAIRVTDTSHSKTYTFQAIHSMPFANIATTAKQLSQMGATTGQVLLWNGSAWAPGNPGGSGTVTSVTGTLPISVATGTSTPAISISQANSTTNGYLSSADWNTFNSKQGTIAAGTALQYYRGDKTWATLDTSAVPENVANLYFTNARVLGVPLTGFVVGAGAITAADSVLSAFQKAQGQINSLTTGSGNYLLKNAADTLSGAVSLTNVITATGAGDIIVNSVPLGLTSAVNKAYVDADDALRVAKAGDTMSGDLILNTQLQLKNGGAANYVTLKAPLAGTTAYTFSLPTTAGTANQVLQTDGTGLTSWVSLPSAPVTSVNTKTGAVVLSTTDVAEGTNLYHTDARTLAAPLTGLSTATNSAVVATDTVLQGFGKSQAQINSLTTSVAGKEPAITAGTTAQYWRGDKTWSTFATDVINSVLSTFTISTASKPAIANTDTVVGAFNKVQKFINDINGDYVSKTANQTINGTLAINSLTGFITVPTPVGASDAANKGYVDGFGQWQKGTNTADVVRAAGNVGIGTTSPSSILDVTSTSSGFLPPRMTTAQKNAIVSPSAGMVVYDTTMGALNVYNSSTWVTVSNAGSAVDPAGMVAGFPMAACPTGWLEANGASVSTTTYASLFTAIGYTYGGSGASFNLPDYRGYFLRGWNHAAGIDPDAATRTTRGDGTTGDNVGTKQADQFGSHTHAIQYAASTAPTGGVGILSGTGLQNYTGAASQAASGVTLAGGNETRGKNINVIYCVSTATNSATTVASIGSGTANYVTKWTSTTALGNSLLYDGGAGIGIGNSAPKSSLDVSGGMAVGTYAGVTAAPANGLIVSGNVGIGTSAPTSNLHVYGSTSMGIVADRPAGQYGAFYLDTAGSPRWGMIVENSAESGSNAGSSFMINRYSDAGAFLSSPFSINRATGNVGIGTIAPSSSLEVYSAANASNFLQISTPGTQASQGSYTGYVSKSDGAKLGSSATNKGWVFGTRGDAYTGDPDNLISAYWDGTAWSIPFRITPAGNVGIGTTGPTNLLTLDGTATGGNSSALVAYATSTYDAFSVLPWNGSTDLASGAYYKNGVWVHKSTGTTSAIIEFGGSGANWYASNNSSASWNVASGVRLWTSTGVLQGASSRDWKENFIKLEKPDILRKINRLNISRWNYKTEAARITHIGPIAEEWANEFGTGEDNKHIALIDEAGVALAGVQGLTQAQDQLEKKISKLETENAKLKQENTAIKAYLCSKDPKASICK